MKQPELGQKINEIRNQKGITQKELSESCNVDIRTVQRIESGEVNPRMSTLRLIASTLECDVNLFNGVGYHKDNTLIKVILILSLIAGIVNFFNWFFLIPLIPGSILYSLGDLNLIFSLVHIFTGVILYLGFFIIGKRKSNLTLQISALIIMILIPLSIISNVLSVYANYSFTDVLKKLIIILMSLNGIAFGAGLILIRGRFSTLNIITGIYQILISPLFLIPVPLVQMTGLWLAVPFLLLLISIIAIEISDTDIVT